MVFNLVWDEESIFDIDFLFDLFLPSNPRWPPSCMLKSNFWMVWPILLCSIWFLRFLVMRNSNLISILLFDLYLTFKSKMASTSYVYVLTFEWFGLYIFVTNIVYKVCMMMNSYWMILWFDLYLTFKFKMNAIVCSMTFILNLINIITWNANHAPFPLCSTWQHWPANK